MDELAPVEAAEGGVAEDVEIRRSTLQVEQKKIFLNLRENSRGRYLRIAEVTGNNRSTIILPSSGLHQFRALLDEFIQSDADAAQGHPVALSGTGDGGEPKSRKKRGGKRAGAGGDGAGGGEGDGEEGRRVFVGNLSWTTQWQGLKDHFSQCGEVVRADVFTERSGRSRGCGIVEFASVEQAMAAVTNMTNTELDGRTIFVREDRG